MPIEELNKMPKDYYYDLMDSTRINSASAIQTEHDRVKGVEEARLNTLLESKPFKHIEQQTVLISQIVQTQNVVIDELKGQTENLKTQVRVLEESAKEAKREAKWAKIRFYISAAIAIASLIIAILAWLRPI